MNNPDPQEQQRLLLQFLQGIVGGNLQGSTSENHQQVRGRGLPNATTNESSSEAGIPSGPLNQPLNRQPLNQYQAPASTFPSNRSNTAPASHLVNTRTPATTSATIPTSIVSQLMQLIASSSSSSPQITQNQAPTATGRNQLQASSIGFPAPQPPNTIQAVLEAMMQQQQEMKRQQQLQQQITQLLPILQALFPNLSSLLNNATVPQAMPQPFAAAARTTSSLPSSTNNNPIITSSSQPSSDTTGTPKEETNSSSSNANVELVYKNEGFPFKLYRMLYELDGTDRSHIASFTPTGDGFHIHKYDQFLSQISPLYFRTQKKDSFRRQLNLYGFRKLKQGLNRGAYVHKHFHRDKPEDLLKIQKHEVTTPSKQAKREERDEDYGDKAEL